MDIVHKYVPAEISDLETIRSCYFEFPKISFDYEVAEKVMKYVNKTFPTDEVNELEIYYHCFPDVEIHYRPFIMHNPIKNQKLYKFFKEEGERCFENRIELPNGIGSISVLTLSVNLVHQMVHISHHWYMEGIGLRLRQLMDYYFLLLNTNDCKIIFMA